MRIAYLINHLGLTGVNNVVLDLVKQMSAHGHDCVVFYREMMENPMQFPCKVEHVNDFRMAEFDVVHIHGLWPMMQCAFSPSYFRKGRKPLLVVTLHCYCFQDFFDLYGRVKGFALGLVFLLAARRFDHIVCLSEDMKVYYRKYLPVNKMRVVYNTRDIADGKLQNISTEREKMLLDFKKGSILIGMNGVLLYRKGVDLMLQAMATLPEQYKLFIAGEGKMHKEFEQMAHELQVDKRVYFAGYQSDAFQFLSMYDVFALPSRSEGFPLALLEAAAMKKKCVVSDLPIVKECFINHEEVEMFKLTDGAEGLAAAIQRAIANQNLGQALNKRFLRDYAPDKFYHNYMQIYNSAR